MPKCFAGSKTASPALKPFRSFLLFYKAKVGARYAKAFADKIQKGVRQLVRFPEPGVLRNGALMGRSGFRDLFIGQYVCIYKIQDNSVFIYHLADGRWNYIYHIFGMDLDEQPYFFVRAVHKKRRAVLIRLMYHHSSSFRAFYPVFARRKTAAGAAAVPIAPGGITRWPGRSGAAVPPR